MKKAAFTLLLACMLVVAGTLQAQVTIGADTPPHASAVLDVVSTTRGFLPPRMTTAQRDVIASPALGLTIFNTTDNSLQTHIGGNVWVAMTNYAHPITAGNKHIPAGGASGNFLKWTADGTAIWAAHGLTASDVGAAASSHSHSATEITSGTLSASRGGTGISSYTAGNYINALNASTLQQRTPAQVRSDIGAGTGTVTNVSAGAGMNFTAFTTTGTVAMGTPGALSNSSTNSASGSTHTHSVTTVLPSGTSAGIMLHSGTKTAGGFYGGTTAPTNTTRANYDGYLYATQLYDGANRVYSAGNTNIGTGAANYAAGNLGLPAFNASDANKVLKINSSLAAVWTASVPVSGDVSVTDAGVITIATSAVTTAKIADNAVTAAKISTPIKTVTSAYTLLVSDKGGFVYVDSSSAVTITVPSLTAGFNCVIVQKGAGQVTIAGSGVTLQTARGTKTRTQFSAVGIILDTVSTATITGDAVN